MSGWRTWGTAIALALAVVVTGGCGKRGADAGAGLGAGGRAGESGFGEAGLGGSSLERARKGLSPAEGGVLGDVRFGYDSYDVDGAGQAVLTENAEWLRANPRAKVELEGHADSRGTIEYNLALGARRAKAVKDGLVALGVAPERLSTISYGEELPLCQEENDQCWARNRRVHSVVLGQ